MHCELWWHVHTNVTKASSSLTSVHPESKTHCQDGWIVLTLRNMAPSIAALVVLCAVFCLFFAAPVTCFTSLTMEELLLIRCSTPWDIRPILLSRSTDLLDVAVKRTAFFISAVRWTRRQRGRRGGCLARLHRRGSRPPLPGIFLGKVSSFSNKNDEL